MPKEGWKKLPRIELVPIPKDIPVSKVHIPSTYTGGDVEHEDNGDNHVNESEATHLRFTGIDRRSDIVVGLANPRGMIKLNLYLNDEEIPVVKGKKHHIVKIGYLLKITDHKKSLMI